MKRVLVAGDSFFRSDSDWPNQHFSELLGNDVEVTNVSGPGFSNTGIMGQILYALDEPVDYCIVGFTSVDRLPIEGSTRWAINELHVQWKTTAAEVSTKERKIIDDFLSLVSYDQLIVNNLAIVERTLQALTEQNIPFVWTLGGMYEIWLARVEQPSVQLMNSINEKYGDRLAMIDYWRYPNIVSSPMYHINDKGYQQMLAKEFTKVLGI